jgi:uroporphyrinogen decarboxylase
MTASTLTGRELILKAMRGETTERAPWVPFVGCHAASLLGISSEEFLKSADRIVDGQTRAIELYKPDGIPVTFDLQVEAEVLGCGLQWAEENPPSVQEHLSEEQWRNERRIPTLEEGRIPVVLEAARRLREANPDLALYGLVTGPFTLAMHLAGANLFMEMYDNAEGVLELVDYCRQVVTVLADGYIDAGCDVIAVVDPMTSQIGPEQFQQFCTPASTTLFEHIRSRGAKGSFFVCGHAQKNIVVMAETKPDNVSVDENIPLDYVKDECLKRNVSFGGNLRLTTVMLTGTPDQNAMHAVETLDLGGTQGYILAPGCDMPYGTPPENVQAIAEVVRDPYRYEVARELLQSHEETSDLAFDMSEYGRADKVIVDVITLDSEGCAPCQYMVEAVKNIMPEFQDLVIWREHKIKQKESIAFMTSLMVRNIPTICIDGQIRFVSSIPRREELIAAIQQRINEKLKVKIRRKRARIRVFADENTDEGQQTLENIEKAITEIGVEVDLEKIPETERARDFGATGIPAVVLSKYDLKSDGRVPEVAAIREWLKDLL